MRAREQRPLGASSADAGFVDHFQATAAAYRRLGHSATNALYPKDHTHTSPAGADVNAKAFADAVKANMNGTTPLRDYMK